MMMFPGLETAKRLQFLHRNSRTQNNKLHLRDDWGIEITMEPHELQEQTERAHHAGEKMVGVTMAIVAVVLALATLLSHRAHTEEILELTQNVDEWDFYQAKHSRAYQFGLTAETQAILPGGRDAAIKNFRISVEEECGVPTAKDCTSPVLKRSPVLQQLLEQNKGAAENPAKTESPEAAHTAAPGKSEPHEKHEKSGKEAVAKEGAVQIQEKAREGQTAVGVLEEKADKYDSAELCLEVSIVLCSIALLTENRMYWKLSFISTVIGIAMAVWGVALR
jgi:hypothetical protein